MVESEEGYQAQSAQFKQITLAYEHGSVLPKDTQLHQEYAVWAMVRQPQNTTGDVDEKYISENQVVAQIKTVRSRALFTFRLGNFGKFKAIYADLL